MRMTKILRNNRGQSIVETAMVLPLILLILFSVFEFGRIFSAYLVITNVSREGARCAVVGGSDLDIVNVISTRTLSLDSTSMQITITPSHISRTRGVQAAVQIDYNVELITPLISNIAPNPFPLRAVTVMRVE
ncbi:MAG: TadG [Clostridia bacterium]|jgi:Flp pilus assembly protein TadG|nr:TadG [Clostridia bacterium]